MPKPFLIDESNPIYIAVHPLLADAMQDAEVKARKRVAILVAELEAAGWDQHAVAPYPSSRTHDAYQRTAAMAKYQDVGSITRFVNYTHRQGEPCPCLLVPEMVEKFVERAKESAADQYYLFIRKLIAKIGPVTSAVLEGNHVWSYSVLLVTKADGSQESWKTQQIINCSKLGKWFPQWPSRKVKR